MKKRLSVLLIAFLALMACNTNNKVDMVIKEIDQLFTTLYPETEPGVALLLMKGEEILIDKGYGIADMESMEPITGETFFNIASVSKQFSAVALMMLHEEGKLSLDDNVSKWFPEFTSPHMEKITLRHLLAHTSGIPDARDRTDRHFVLTATDVDSYSYIATLETLNFEPGTAYEYMNPTYQLMYTIVERASGGIPFETFMRERIFDVVGMENAIYFEEGRKIYNMSHAYRQDKETGDFYEFDYGEDSFFATKADGGLYTSTREFVQWELGLRKNLLITPEALQEMHTPVIKIESVPFTSYGYGWYIEKRPGFPTKIYHTGDNGGYQIYAGRYHNEEILYLFFSNRDDRDRAATAHKIDEILKRGLLLK